MHRLDWDNAVRDEMDTVRVIVDPAPSEGWADALSAAHRSRYDECRGQVYDEAHLMGDSLVLTKSPEYAEQLTRDYWDMLVGLADRSPLA